MSKRFLNLRRDERRIELVICCFVILITSQVRAETYFVRADGQATRLSQATSCASPATAIDVLTHNFEYFSPGDRIVLCHEGGVFRQGLDPRSNGTSESPIIIDGRGTAVMSAADIVTDWYPYNGDVWAAELSEFYVPPQQLFVNGVFGRRTAGIEELQSDLDWFWAEGTLYLHSSGGNPRLVYNHPGVEAGNRGGCIDLGNSSHITVEGLTAKHSNYNGIAGWNAGTGIAIRKCILEWNWLDGVNFAGDTNYTNIIVEDNISRFNGMGGISFHGPGSELVVRRNRCYENGKFQSSELLFEPQHIWTYGIKFWEYAESQQGNDVYFNEVFHNGREQPVNGGLGGVGIWFDLIPGHPDNPNVIRHNLVYENANQGIFIEVTSNSLVYGNVLFNNAYDPGGRDEFLPASLVIDARENRAAENNRVFNNTIVGGRVGIRVVTYDQWPGITIRNNIIANNIVVDASEHVLYCRFGGDNDGSIGYGNKYQNNNFGLESRAFIHWGGIKYDTYDSWDAVYGQPSDSVEGEPLFAGASRTSLYLTRYSPCRGTGINLEPNPMVGLIPWSVWPQRVKTIEHNARGQGWDLGAYPFFSGTERVESSNRRIPSNLVATPGK